MSTPFPRWQDALNQSDNDAARHALIGQVSQWRAGHLTDVVGQRDAAYTLAKLYSALGDKSAALREAQGLLSLCMTPPEAPDAEQGLASSLLVSLGGKAPRRRAKKPAARPTPTRGPDRAPAPRGGSGVERALELGREGNYTEAFRLLKGKSSPQVFAARTWLDLSRALAETGDQREKRLNALLRRMEQILPKSALPAPAPAPKAPPPEPTGRLGDVLGRGLPTRRPAMLRVLHRFIDDNTDKADAVASAALLDHLDTAGATAPAPWLAGLVARAQVDGGTQTQAALQAMADAGSEAGKIYEEPPFAALVGVFEAARGQGYAFVDLRRGTMRGEPDDRRLWTLRLRQANREGFIVLGSEQSAPYDETVAVEIAKRLMSLSDKPVLVAPGEGNAGLRGAAAALGVAVVDVDGALPAMADRMVERRPDAGRNDKAAGTKATEKASPAQPPAPRRPTLAEYVDQVRAVLTGDGEVTVDVLEPLVAPIKRIRDVLELGDELVSPDASERLKALVLAIHRTAPSHVRLLQATTLLLKASAKPGKEALAELLTQGETAGRLGGEGVESVIQAAHSLQNAGYELDRVLRGATRRERREHPAIDVLADHLDGLWRLIITKGDVRGEVWVAHALPPEGQAGLPQLALRPGPRVSVVAEGLQAEWSAVGAPAIVALPDLVDAVGAW